MQCISILCSISVYYDCPQQRSRLSGSKKTMLVQRPHRAIMTEQKNKSWKRQNAKAVLSLQQECWSQFWIPLAKNHGGKFTWWALMIFLFLLSKFSPTIYFLQLPFCECISGGVRGGDGNHLTLAGCWPRICPQWLQTRSFMVLCEKKPFQRLWSVCHDFQLEVPPIQFHKIMVMITMMINFILELFFLLSK